MNRFVATRDVLAQVKKFKEYKENRNDASIKERDFDNVVFRYLMEYILFVFSGESKNLQRDMLKYCIKKAKGSNLNKKGLKKIIDSVLSQKGELPRKYDTFIENRNQAAHPKQAIFLTWDEFINIELYDGHDVVLDIADIGEKMLELINEELNKSI